MATELARVPCGSHQRLRFSWGPGSELYCCAVNSSEGQLGDEEGTSTAVQWDCPGPISRRIIYDAHVKYVECEQVKGDPLLRPAQLEQFCTDVGAIMDASLPDDEELFDEEAQLIAEERALWTILSLFFGGMGESDRLISQELASWLQVNAAVLLAGEGGRQLSPASLAAFESADYPELTEGYWETLQRLVCLGWTADALSLLGLHSAWAAWKSGGSLHPALAGRIRSLDAVASLLRCFPRLAGAGAAAGSPRRGAADSGAGQELSGAEEFLSYRARWQGQSALVLGEGSLWEGEHEAPCRALLACMAGDVEQSSRLATSWPELLVARLLAGHPAVGRAADLLHLVRAAAAARPPPAAGLGDAAAALSARALALLTACAGLDAQAALQACSHGASAWLSAHAALVVAQHPAGRQLESDLLAEYGCTQPEFYKLNFVSALASHEPTRSVARGYLAWCPHHGEQALHSLDKRMAAEATQCPALQGLCLPQES
ncbi:NUP85 [Auxenochlorella protothecoides x Auxenochlorella symbiontica]